MSKLTTERLIVSSFAGLSITVLVGVANYLAMRAGYVRLGNLLFKLILWSWPIFGAFFDFVTNTESTRSPHRWGGYTALIFDVALFSSIIYAMLGIVLPDMQSRLHMMRKIILPRHQATESILFQ